jgi:hypothetical protein
MNLQEQLNRIQEIMTKIANEDFSDYGDLSNPDKLEKDFQKYIETKEPRGVGKIHQSIGDDLGQMIRTLKQDFGFKKIKYVDQGHFGMAFDVGNNKVLKLTSNENEIRGIRKVLNKDIPGVVKYYDIKHYPQSNVYAILMDKVKPLSKKEETIYTVIYYEMANHSDSDFWDNYDDTDEDIREEFIEELIDRLESPRPEDELPSFKIDEYDLVNYIDTYRELLKTLESNNVPTEDLHGGNIGRKDNKLIHFDVMDFPEN